MADPHYNKVVLHLPFNEYAAEPAILPDCSIARRGARVFGTAALSAAQSKYGAKSLYLADTGTAYVELATSPDFDLGTEDFTIEAWFYTDGTAGLYRTLLVRQDPVGVAIQIRLSPSNRLEAVLRQAGGEAFTMSGSSVVSSSAWHHAALVRASGVFTLYLDGTADVTLTQSVALDGSVPIVLGQFPAVTQPLNGYLDDLRITKGVARYTANFTPPAAIEHTTWAVGGAVLSSACKAFSPYADAAPTFGVMNTLRTVIRDTVDAGRGKIVGTVKEKGTPDAPVARRVLLHRQRDGRCIREMWSSAAGNYSFTFIDETEKYYVVSFDHTGDYQGVVADKLTPELM